MLTEAIAAAYPDTVALTCDDTGLSLATFPADCAYTAEQLLDKTYYPTAPRLG